MAFTTEKKRYETLIRWHDDGTIGAHQIDKVVVHEDGKLLSESLTEPKTLGNSDYEGSQSLADVLSQVAVDAVTAQDLLNDKLTESQNLVQNLVSQIGAYEKEIESLKEQISSNKPSEPSE